MTTTEKPTSGMPATPPRLTTLTDLSKEQVQAVTAAVNPLIADAFALYVKTKNYHWHLSGRRFRDLHLLFDEHAEAIFASIDVMAERVRRIGGTTIRSIKHIGQLQTIQDDGDTFVTADEMVHRLLEDNARIAKNIRAAIAVCEKNQDSATANQLEEILDETERRKWFLFETNQTDEA